MRTTTDHLGYFRELQEAPFAFDFYKALRRIECLFPNKPKLGQALRPQDEPVRMGQAPSLSFAPAILSSCKPGVDGRPPRLEVASFGLLGPNGPLPLHLTDYARERLMHAGDPTFARFLDLINHRFLLLFYRAWAQAQPTVSLDRPRQDRFAIYVGSLHGVGTLRVRSRDAVGDLAKLFYSGLLVRHIRNSDGLVALLTGYFRMPFRLERFVGHWMSLPREDRTRLSSAEANANLGGGAVLGSRIWDRQHKFRLWIGPLTLAQYEGFLPRGKAIEKLVAWLRQYLCFEFDWDARLILKCSEVPKTRLGEYGRLGWTTWLGRRIRDSDADDLTLAAERLMTASTS